MASLTKRTLILAGCRLANYSVQLLSPIFLVRIFDVAEFGQYREFILYATLSTALFSFAIPTNLIYFIPKRPDRERESVTNSILLLLLTSLVGILAVYLGRDLIRARTSYDFILPLILYFFFFVNLDIYESYALGKRQSLNVLYYSSARVIVRIVAAVATAYLTRSVEAVLWSLIIVEIARCLFLLILLGRLFTKHIDRALLREQLRFIVPLGSSSIIGQFNAELAKLVISVAKGPGLLAQYSIGSYQIPILAIVRSSVIDVIFPEMTQAGDRDRLRLWQMANVAFCFMIFPVVAVFLYYAGLFLETIFTHAYVEAVPIFRIYLAVLVLQCFEMGTPIRTINENKYFIFGSIISLVVDIGIILAFFKMGGFLIPAIAMVVGEGAIAWYLGMKILRLYRITLGELFMWRKLLLVATATLGAAPVFFLGEFVPMNALLRAVLFSCAYGIVYLLIVRGMKMPEIILIERKVMQGLQRFVPSRMSR